MVAETRSDPETAEIGRNYLRTGSLTVNEVRGTEIIPTAGSRRDFRGTIARPLIATIGEAHDLGWRLTVYCRFGERDGMKSIRECTARVEVDLATLVWTRGRDFPIARLDSRMKCARCGSRRAMVAFEPPPAEGRARAAVA
jgi:hypothetical protein